MKTSKEATRSTALSHTGEEETASGHQKAHERWPKLHAEGPFMTRKLNPSTVRRDEVHWEEASTFPSSKSWQGKVCIFHPAHVSRVQRAKTFSIFHLIILLPRIYPLIAHTRSHMHLRSRLDLTAVRFSRCASCISPRICVTLGSLWNIWDPTNHQNTPSKILSNTTMQHIHNIPKPTHLYSLWDTASRFEMFLFALKSKWTVLLS